jgi:nicotinate phosphoribosyltransferase
VSSERPGSASPLFVDLYELTMGEVYHRQQLTDPAVFEAFFQHLPDRRNYVVACGQERVLDLLQALPPSPQDLDYLRSLNLFSESYLAALGSLRFMGDVFAVPEGTLVFPDEPIVQVIARPLEAQIVETFLLNQLHAHALAVTKALRIIDAAAGRGVVDFGSRRAHGQDMALITARLTYAAGGSGTSNVLAGRLFGIPVFGTMAHSFVSLHDCEEDAFRSYTAAFPGSTLLVDTHDSLAAVRSIVRLGHELGDGFQVGGIRIDSGDLGALAHEARRILDAGGLGAVKIFVSSDLDEYAIAKLVTAGAPIDGFGVGSRLVQSADVPGLDLKYKLVAYAGSPRTKSSTGKSYLGGRKQILRRWRDGAMAGDELVPFELAADLAAAGAVTGPDRVQPLLRPLVRGGAPVVDARTELAVLRRRIADQLATLPGPWRALTAADERYPVTVHPALRGR